MTIASELVAAAVLDLGDLPGGPVHDVALGPALLKAGDAFEGGVVRVYSPRRTAAFSRRDSRQPGFAAAAAAARDLGFTPVIRPQGGRLAVYHEGSLIIDQVLRRRDAAHGLAERFEAFAAVHQRALRALGADVRVGELDGEYCPGEYSLNVAGRFKVVGSAQRITRDGWLFSTTVQVTGTALLRAATIAAYEALGYDLRPLTVGSLEDAVAGLTPEQVRAALLPVHAPRTAARCSQLPAAVLEELERTSAQRQVG
jgi:lipoate-protein ligase A